MVTITDRAGDALEAIDTPTGSVLRLEPTTGAQGVALVIGAPAADDVVVAHRGSDLLHISAAISDLLDGLVIDEEETPDGPSLTIGRARD